MRILIVDHEDSFLWNLVQAFGARVGSWPRVLSHRDEEGRLAALRWRPQLVVLGPGPGHAARARDAGLGPRLLDSLPERVPVFGVCLGLQIVVDWMGGRLCPARDVVHGKSTPIRHDGAGPFRGLSPDATMMRYHSWVADATALPSALDVRASTPEGEVMAITHRERPIEAVQFHPESVGSSEGDRLLDNVVRWAREQSDS